MPRRFGWSPEAGLSTLVFGVRSHRPAPGRAQPAEDHSVVGVDVADR